MATDPPAPGARRVIAVLGPTNTGKTHFAMERLLAHPGGMIGFPLRLLARENYDRAVRIKGERRVALITGEEKILPPDARWFLCTVESMPVDRRFDFVAVDEVQMCVDPDRGHVFTDRLLHARGTAETMFMGAETIRPLLRRLVPDAEYVTRPRMSRLSYTGPRKTTRLPPRSAVVAFSAAGVYHLAELVRRQRGGAAVVLGALSPRTRNAQVAMYQAGEVDYLVATDAIGMGLNMDVDHVAFAGLEKFDGRRHRPLGAAELAQTAGRAGRHMNDGTFGTTAEAQAIDPEVAARIEEHHFDPLKLIYWRNDELDFGSVDGLRRSLRLKPTTAGLVRAREADDELVLGRLAHDAEVARLAAGPDAVRLLWDVCQVPDFRNVMSDGHARLLSRIYRHLLAPAGRLPEDCVAEHVGRLDRDDGDIETLLGRIAAIRTWTYVSYRADWLGDARHWRERTRAIEDRLSDALHERLTQRFVDRRTARLVSRMQETPDLVAAVRATGEVLVEGEPVGRLEGFHYVHAGLVEGAADRAVVQAARRALNREMRHRLEALDAAPDDALALAEDDGGGLRPRILWQGAEVGRVVAGSRLLRPHAEPLLADLIEGDDRERLRRHLQAWLDRRLRLDLAALYDFAETPVAGAARGLVFQVVEGLGSVGRDAAADQLAALTVDDRRALRAMGLRIGRVAAFLPALVKARTVALRALLWRAHYGARDLAPPPPGRASVPVDGAAPAAFLAAAGYLVLGPRTVRVDIAERLAGLARRMAGDGDGSFAVDPAMTSLLGASIADTAAVLAALGYRRLAEAEGADAVPRFAAPAPGRGRGRAAAGATDKPKGKKARAKRRGKGRPPRPEVDPSSPFAELEKLRAGGR